MKTKNIILGGVLALVGILMLAMPGACIKAVVVIVGLAAVAFSIYNLFVVYKQTEDAEYKKVLLVKSILTFVVGLISVVSPFVLVKTVATIWKIISIVLAAYLILYGGLSVFSAAKIKENFRLESKHLIKEALICVAIAVLLIIIPIESFGKAFIRTVGLAGLLVGIIMICVELVINKRTAVKGEAEEEGEEEEEKEPEKETSSSEDAK